MPSVVSLGTSDESTEELQARIRVLEKRVKVLTRIMVLLLTLVRIARLTLNNTRVPDPDDRGRLLRGIHRSEGVLLRGTALRVIGLSPSRYGQWSRYEQLKCPLGDSSHCARTQPGQLTAEEVGPAPLLVKAMEATTGSSDNTGAQSLMVDGGICGIRLQELISMTVPGRLRPTCSMLSTRNARLR